MAEQTRLRVGQNGRMVIPTAFRKAMGIEVGDEILLLRITTQQRCIHRAQRQLGAI